MTKESHLVSWRCDSSIERRTDELVWVSRLYTIQPTKTPREWSAKWLGVAATLQNIINSEKKVKIRRIMLLGAYVV